MKAPRRQSRWAEAIGLEMARPAYGWRLLPVSLAFALCFSVMTALAVGAVYDSLGRQGAFPAADPVPRRKHRARRVAMVEPIRLRRPAPDRRPAVDDLLAAVPAAGVGQPHPSAWEIDMTVLAAMSAGGIGMIVWFRDRGWHWAGALIAALVFSFGAAMAWRMQHIGQVLSLAYLPSRSSVDRALERGSPRYGLAGPRRACIVLGRDQVALLASICSSRYVLWRCLPISLTARAAAAPAAAWPCRCVGLCPCYVPVLMTALLGRRLQPARDRLRRRRRRLAAPRAAADAPRARRFRRVRPHGPLLGPAKLGVAGHRPLHRAERRRDLRRRVSAAAGRSALLSGRLWDREIRFFTIALS